MHRAYIVTDQTKRSANKYQNRCQSKHRNIYMLPKKLHSNGVEHAKLVSKKKFYLMHRAPSSHTPDSVRIGRNDQRINTKIEVKESAL
jgi:hypothetical protein